MIKSVADLEYDDGKTTKVNACIYSIFEQVICECDVPRNGKLHAVHWAFPCADGYISVTVTAEKLNPGPDVRRGEGLKMSCDICKEEQTA